MLSIDTGIFLGSKRVSAWRVVKTYAINFVRLNQILYFLRRFVIFPVLLHKFACKEGMCGIPHVIYLYYLKYSLLSFLFRYAENLFHTPSDCCCSNECVLCTNKQQQWKFITNSFRHSKLYCIGTHISADAQWYRYLD